MPTQTNKGYIYRCSRAKDTLWQNDDNILNRERHLKAIFKQMIIDLINSLIYDTKCHHFCVIQIYELIPFWHGRD